MKEQISHKMGWLYDRFLIRRRKKLKIILCERSHFSSPWTNTPVMFSLYIAAKPTS